MPWTQQLQIQAESATYTTAHSNAGSPTHWVRPWIEPASSWILIRFISAVPHRNSPLDFEVHHQGPMYFPEDSQTVSLFYFILSPRSIYATISSCMSFKTVELHPEICPFRVALKSDPPNLFLVSVKCVTQAGNVSSLPPLSWSFSSNHSFSPASFIPSIKSVYLFPSLLQTFKFKLPFSI